MSINSRNSALLSSVLLAVTSSLCCIVPVLTIVGGIAGAASSFAWVTPLRPYLISSTVLCLGFAFYQAYKPVKKDSCGCDIKRISFWQSKAFLWTITCLSALLLTFPYYSHVLFEPAQKNISASSPIRDTTVSFLVIGMSCESCEAHVNKALLDQIGVTNAITNYDDSLTTVTYDKSRVSLATLKKIVTEKTHYQTIP